MYSKNGLNFIQQIQGISESEVPTYYYYGALVDSTNGKTFLLKEPSPSLDIESHRQLCEFQEKYSHDLSTEVPLTQVFASENIV